MVVGPWDGLRDTWLAALCVFQAYGIAVLKALLLLPDKNRTRTGLSSEIQAIRKLTEAAIPGHQHDLGLRQNPPRKKSSRKRREDGGTGVSRYGYELQSIRPPHLHHATQFTPRGITGFGNRLPLQIVKFVGGEQAGNHHDFTRLTNFIFLSSVLD